MENIERFSEVLKSLGVDAIVEDCQVKGPLHRYSVRLGTKTRPSKLEGLSSDIALAMRAVAQPLIRPKYEDGILIVELMYSEHPIVSFAELAQQANYPSPELFERFNIPLLIGAEDIDVPLIRDLTTMPHMLVAGASGSGKSIFLHSVIASLCAMTDNVGIKLALIDPKYVEFSIYEKHKALMYPVVNDVEVAIEVLSDLQEEVERRLKVFRKYGCRDAHEYRATIKKIPYIVVVIDELADLMKSDKKNVERRVCELAQKCRAAGIFIIAATQHPSSKIITGDIKANFPVKVAFKVSTHTHSRVILDRNGAERLLGKGDGLIVDDNGTMHRFKGALAKMPEKKASVAKVRKPSIVGSLLAAAFSSKKLG